MERIDDGEVSPYLTEELRVGEELELRGPIGGYFNWRNENGGPLLLIAGGSGLVPLMAMLRHRAATASTVDARLLLSARSLEDVLYREELGKLAAGDGLAVHYTLTREPPPGWGGFARRIDAEMLTTVGPAPARGPRIYVCGPSAFVERAADCPRPARSPHGCDPNRAVRPDGLISDHSESARGFPATATAWTSRAGSTPCGLGRFCARPIL